MAQVIDRFLCIASYEKGQDFMRQCAEMGVKVTLLTVEKLQDAAWPREVLEGVHLMPNDYTTEDLTKTVCWMCRGRQFDRVIALDEFDLDAAAKIREHTRISGMGVTSTAYYRDKLAMRTGASESGFLVPPFCRVLNYDELRSYMTQVHGPWLLKPRAEASVACLRYGIGIAGDRRCTEFDPGVALGSGEGRVVVKVPTMPTRNSTTS